MSRSMKCRITRLVPACLLVVSAAALTGCGPEDDTSEKSGSAPSSSQAADPADAATQEEAAEVEAAPEAPSSEPSSEPEADAGSDVGALVKAAYAGKFTIRCTFDQEGTKGTAYIKGNAHMRMDMNTPQGEMHLLNLDGTSYMWGAGFPQGMKFEGETLNESFDEQFKAFTPEELEKSAEENGVQCEEYSGDETMFDMPAGVTFKSIGQGF